MEIVYLADNMMYAEKAAGWIFYEFIKGIRLGISYDQILLSFKNCSKIALPIRLIAIEDGKCVGTVSIVDNDLLCRNYTPWLSSLYVDAQYRKRRIGEQLVDRVKTIAGELGFSELYLRTEHAGDYYKRLGWEHIESCVDEFKLDTDVYKFHITQLPRQSQQQTPSQPQRQSQPPQQQTPPQPQPQHQTPSQSQPQRQTPPPQPQQQTPPQPPRLSLSYRKATADDIELIAAARVEFFAERRPEMTDCQKAQLYSNIKVYLEAELTNDIFANFTAYLAFDGEQLVATSGASYFTLPPAPHNPSGKTVYISNMYTIPAYRGKGAATRLFHMLVEDARERGCGKATLIATDMGRPIYEKYGFTAAENAMDYFF